MNCCSLHTHSENSTLDGVARVTENAQRAADLGHPAIALTDHAMVNGWFELQEACEKLGVKPIFGVEAYLGTKKKGVEIKGQERDQPHQILLAKTDEGVENIYRILNEAATDERFHHVDRITWDALERHSKGVLATSTCMGGIVPRALAQGDYEPLNRSLDIFGDDYFIELHTYDSDEQRRLNVLLMEIAQERGIPVIYANDAHFAYPDQYPIYDLYIARQHGDSIYTPIDKRKIWHPPGMHIQSEEEVRENLSYLPGPVVDEAISNTGMIADMVDAKLPAVERHMPIFVPKDCPWKEQFDETKTPEEIFRDLVWQGLRQRYGRELPQAVTARAEMEIEALTDPDQGLWHYFLLGWDTKQFCAGAKPAPGFDYVEQLREAYPKEVVTGPGRGSSAGCICAYALGITDVDPLPYDLYFERFWNPGRAKGFPDIDTDFPRRARATVIKYLGKRWGEDRVRQIGNVSRMKPKDVIEKTGKACGAYDSEITALKNIVGKHVPDLEIHGPDQIGWSEESWPGKVIYVMHPTEGECAHGESEECAHCHTTGSKIVEWVEKQPRKRLKLILDWLEFIDFLCGRVGGKGVHASGVVVSDKSLLNRVACRYAKGDVNAAVTQANMEEVEDLMYVKYDALGLRTLDTLEEWRDLVGEEGVHFNWSGLEWEDHPVEMWRLLDDEYAAGIFQIERGYPKRLAREIKPRSIEDLSAVLALNRPGPIRSGAPDRFLARRKGEEPVTYADTKDPSDPKNGWLLAPILEPTYGLFLYQEGVIKFFETIGYSKSDADAIRKILGKKKPEVMRDVGLGQGEWEGKGYRQVAKDFGLQDVAIGNIWRTLEGFASYSFNKSHTVAYGTITFRTLFAKYYGPTQFYLSCVRTVDQQKKAEFIPRYINEARRMDIRIDPPRIDKSQAIISVVDDSIYYGFCDVKNVSSSGTFIPLLRDEYGYDVSTPDALSAALDQYTKDNNITEERKRAKELGLPQPKTGKQHFQANKIEFLEQVGAFDTEDTEYNLRERQEAEKELLGVILSDNAADAYANNQEQVDQCNAYEEVNESHWDGEDLRFVVPGVITGIEQKNAKKSGKKMGIVTIEYEGDEIEFVVRPDLWVSHKFLWHDRTPGIFRLKRYEGGISFEKGHKLS